MNMVREIQETTERREETSEAEVTRVIQESKNIVAEHVEQRRIAESSAERMQTEMKRAVTNTEEAAQEADKLLANLTQMQREKEDSAVRIEEK